MISNKTCSTIPVELIHGYQVSLVLEWFKYATLDL